jgi:AraC family transcriptional regulator
MAARLSPGDYYGQIVGQGSCSGALFSELDHRSPKRLPRHTHGHSFACMLTRGGYRERWGRSDVWYDPFTVVFHPEDFCHMDEIGPGGAHLFVMELPKSSFESLGLSAPTGVRTGSREFPVSQAALRLLAAQRSGESLDEPFAILAAELARARNAVEKSRPHWLDQVVEMIHEECSQPLTLLQMARQAAVHPVHLSRTFRQFEGCSLSTRLRQLRLKRAMRAIVESTASLADIAASCGFTDQSHMNRTFGELLGMTPGRFRLMLPRQGHNPPQAGRIKLESQDREADQTDET